MFQAESNLVLRQLFVAALKQVSSLFVKFELSFGDFSHAAPSSIKNAGHYDRRFSLYWLMFASVINRLFAVGGSRLK
jgi:hypothetical protein